MSKRHFTAWHILGIVLLGWPAWADVVQLTDGTKLEGTLQREQGEWVVTDSSGKVTRVSDDQVARIEKTGAIDPKAVAENQLNGLRRGVDLLADLDQIIDRYTRFVAEYKNTPAGEVAQQELAVWKDRQARGMMKVGMSWITPDERMQLLGKTATIVEEARGLIKEGRYPEAEAVVERILEADAENASGLYLRGVVAYQLGDIGVARKWLTRVRELIPNHGPTLNNLAVIAWQQEQYSLAIGLFDQAMTAAPRTRRILDNTAETLQALPAHLRDSAVGRRAVQHFRQQDAELQKELEAEGLMRWGAVYLNKAQQAELKKLEARLDLLAQDYEKIKGRLKVVNGQIDANEQTIDRIDDERAVWWDSKLKRYVRLPRPSIYYQVKRENDRLRAERQELLDKLPTYEEKRQQVLRESPIQPFTGIHRLIEAEGTPLAVLKPANAAPSTQPSGGAM